MQIVKIMLTLYLLVMIQLADSFPQFSIPVVSWTKKKDDPSRLTLNIKVQNPFYTSFGKNGNSKQDEKSQGNNFANNYNNEKIITVTPNTVISSFKNEKSTINVPTTQDSTLWGIFTEQNYGVNGHMKDVHNVQNLKKTKESADKLQNGHFDLSEEDLNKIFKDVDVTTDSTTEYETTTDFESTTEDLSSLNRSGVSGHVVASLLG